MISTADCIQWSASEYANFGAIAQVAKHSYHDLPLFTDSAITALLQAYPRSNLQAHTMGDDRECFQDWKQININRKTTGSEILEAVRKGRMWINLTHIEQHNMVFRRLIGGMYDHLGEHCPQLRDPVSTHSALIISSPNAQVYYHLDAEPNMLWHIRGQKRIWMYPAMNMDLVPQEILENIYAGEIDEDLPYKKEFDELAVCHLLGPGDVASWPHNAPHRIENLDLNVSLATSYATKDTYRRQYVQLANRYVLRGLGIRNRSMQENGMRAAMKRCTYRVLNKIRPFKRRVTANYRTDLELDAKAPGGTRKLTKPILPEFARAEAPIEHSTAGQHAA